MKALLSLLAFVLLQVAQPANARDDVILTVEGEIASPKTFTDAEFRALPRATAQIKDRTGVQHIYEGVSLTHLLGLAGVPLKQGLKHDGVAKYLHAQGRDGYVAVFALPEFDSQ